jgi:hypothetical protein
MKIMLLYLFLISLGSKILIIVCILFLFSKSNHVDLFKKVKTSERCTKSSDEKENNDVLIWDTCVVKQWLERSGLSQYVD